MKDPLQEKVLEVYRRLVQIYGEPERGRLDPVSELVSTILSQNTNDLNRDRAYNSLRGRFPTWEAMLGAPVDQIEKAIRVAGLWREKAPRIQESLRRITRERGELSLAFLAEMPVPKAKAWLRRLPGVGPKTAAIILLFSLGKPAFPVDTHVHRVATRLGLVPKVSAEKAHDLLEARIPPETYLAYHINLIRHGRAVCRPKPLCSACGLRDVCEYIVE